MQKIRDRFLKNFRKKPAESGNLSPSPRLLKLHEELWQGPPPEFARDIDIEFCLETINLEIMFQQIVPIPNSVIIKPYITASEFFYVEAPAEVRSKICSYCFPCEPRKITLSPYFFLKAVFSEAYHASPWDVLEHVLGGLHAFRALRLDLMGYFWTFCRFHITLNMFSGPMFSPLSHFWLPDYLGIIQDLTIELDFTKFGGSSSRYAENYGYDCRKIAKMLKDIIFGISRRGGDLPMARYVHLGRISYSTCYGYCPSAAVQCMLTSGFRLHLLCRRYNGRRFVSRLRSNMGSSNRMEFQSGPLYASDC